MSGLPAQLSMGVASFSAEDPGGWAHLAEQARLLDEAGFDRLAVSDHVVFGEALEEYGRPEQIAAWRDGKAYVASLAEMSAGR